MNDRHIKKLIAAGISIAAAAGAALVATDYAAGSDFHPFSSGREMLANRIFFPDSSSTAGYDKNKDDPDNDNSFWEEDQSSDQTERPDSQNDSGYMFESSMLFPDGSVSAVSELGSAENSSDGNPFAGVSGSVYDITGDGRAADVIISGASGDGSLGRGSTGGASDGSASGSKNIGTVTGTGSGGGSFSGGGGAAGGGAGGSTDNGGTVSPSVPDNGSTGGNSGPVAPDKVKDPAPSKPDPLPNYGFSGVDKFFSEYERNGFSIESILARADAPDRCVLISQSGSSDAAQLYTGQSIDEVSIFNALDACILLNESMFGNINKSTCYFSSSDLGSTFRIKAVSFDGQSSWITSFPVTIPEGISEGQMYIKVEYRLTASRDWTERIIPYMPSVGRLFVLSKKLTSGYTAIENDDIVNTWKQFPESGELVNLFQMQPKYLSGGGYDLDALFPGWTENGKPVDWFYEMTPGRHILEPADTISIDESYSKSFKLYWYDSSTDQFDEYLGGDLCYLQTITGYEHPLSADPLSNMSAFSSVIDDDVFVIPKYSQAVDIDYGSTVTVDYIDIPDTVLYINGGSGRLKINKGYRVAAGNTHYSSENGILYDRSKTKILGIPSETTMLSVPGTVDEVTIPDGMHISEIELIEPRDGKWFPDFYGDINNCKFLMDENNFENFLYEHRNDLFYGKNNCLADPDDPDVTYILDNAAVINSRHELYRVLDIGAESIKLPNDLETVTTYVFAGASSMKKILLPSNGRVVEFERSSLRFSNIDTIVCSSMEQYEYMKRMLEAGEDYTFTDESGETHTEWNPYLGLSDVTLVLTKNTSANADGYTYTEDGTDADGNILVTLISAPSDVTQFDGTLYDADGHRLIVTSVSDNAFDSCSKLVWVRLPDTVSYIGYRAFAGCSSLQGVLMDRRTDLTIGNDAFSDCGSLRFAAANASELAMVGGYDPEITDRYGNSIDYHNYFFVMPDAKGSGSNASNLSNVKGISKSVGYRLERLQSSDSEDVDSWLLCFDFYDSDDNLLRLAIRSGSVVPEHILLPDGVVSIYNYAFADTASATGGAYEIDWDKASALRVINTGVFYNSMLSGDVNISAVTSWTETIDVKNSGGSNSDSDDDSSNSSGNGSGADNDNEDNSDSSGRTADQKQIVTTVREPFWLDDRAFANTGIDSISINARLTYLGIDVFNGCSLLKKAVFTEIDDSVGFYPGLFTGCSSLTTIGLEHDIPTLIMYGSYPFLFDYDRADEGRYELHVELPASKEDNPELFNGCVNDLIKKWRFPFAGASGAYMVPYLEVRSNAEFDFLTQNDRLPNDQELNEAVEQIMFNAENIIRAMVGADPAAEPTNIYHYKLVDNYYVYLVGVPKNEYYADLFPGGAWFPDGWTIDYISRDSFMNCYQLYSVDIPGSMVGIESGAFRVKSLNGDKLKLYMYGETPVKLMPDAEGTPFDFGIDDDKLSIVILSGKPKELYINAWKYPLAGFDDAEAMYASVKAEYKTDDNKLIVEAMADKLIASNAVSRLCNIMSYAEDIDRDTLIQYIREDLGLSIPWTPIATPTEYPATPSEYSKKPTPTKYPEPAPDESEEVSRATPSEYPDEPKESVSDDDGISESGVGSDEDEDDELSDSGGSNNKDKDDELFEAGGDFKDEEIIGDIGESDRIDDIGFIEDMPSDNGEGIPEIDDMPVSGVKSHTGLISELIDSVRDVFARINRKEEV